MVRLCAVSPRVNGTGEFVERAQRGIPPHAGVGDRLTICQRLFAVPTDHVLIVRLFAGDQERFHHHTINSRLTLGDPFSNISDDGTLADVVFARIPV